MGYESEKCINFADGSRTNCIADLTARLLTLGDGISTKEEEFSPKILDRVGRLNILIIKQRK